VRHSLFLHFASLHLYGGNALVITQLLVFAMVRLKCKKCGNVFEEKFLIVIFSPHAGPCHLM